MAAPAATGVANNSEEPGASIASGKRPKVSEGPQGRLLNDIFGVVLIAYEPSRQPIGRTKMRQNDIVKSLIERWWTLRSKHFVTHEALRELAEAPDRASDIGSGSRCRAVGCSRTGRPTEGGRPAPRRIRVGPLAWARATRAAESSRDGRTLAPAHASGSDRCSRGNTGRHVSRTRRR